MIERRQSIAAIAATAATRTLPLRLCAVALLMTQAGCSVMSTAYERPAAPVPASYALAAADAPPGAASLLPWQDYFADPRLRQLLDIALTNNRDLRVAMLNVEQTRAQFQLRRADLYPGVDLNAKASRGRATDGKPNPSFGLGLAVTAWEIDFFGRIASLKDQALAQYLASQEGRNAAQLSLVASVANGWLNLLADEELLGLSRQTLASRESSARLTRMRLDAGVVSELDWHQAESLTQDARATLAQHHRQPPPPPNPPPPPPPRCWAGPCRTPPAPAWRAAGWPMRRRWCHCQRACRRNCSRAARTSARPSSS